MTLGPFCDFVQNAQSYMYTDSYYNFFFLPLFLDVTCIFGRLLRHESFGNCLLHLDPTASFCFNLLYPARNEGTLWYRKI